VLANIVRVRASVVRALPPVRIPMATAPGIVMSVMLLALAGPTMPYVLIPLRRARVREQAIPIAVRAAQMPMGYAVMRNAAATHAVIQLMRQARTVADRASLVMAQGAA
jgi:hypothetical protein